MGPFISRLGAGAALALGLELILGWVLRSEPLLRILPSSNAISLNAALGLALCGLAMLLTPGHRLFALRRGISVVVGVGAAAILFENVADIGLGLDWVSLHGEVQAGSPRPGRVAPNTCVAFILLSVMLYPRALADTPAQRLSTRICSILLIALVASGVVGLMLDPTLLYGWYRFNRMAAPAVIGLSLLALAVYAQYRTERAQQSLTMVQHQRSVLLAGALILLATGLAATVTTAVVFANHQLQVIHDQLRATLGGQIKLVDVLIAQAETDAAALNQRPLLLAAILRSAQRRDAAGLSTLQMRLDELRKQGFAGLQLQWADGTVAATAGGFDSAVQLAVPLQLPMHGHLLWRREGYSYRHTTEFAAPDGRVVARLVTEQALKALAPAVMPGAAAADEGEVICGSLGGQPACFPSKLLPRPELLPAVSARSRLPVDDALAGQSGLQSTQNRRGVNVVVAYSPVGSTGLVMLSAAEATKLYQPVGHLLSRSLAVLAIALLVGVWLLRATIGPLLAAMARAEARAVDSRRRLQSITDQLPALIGFVNADLRYEFVNATYGRWFGRPTSEMLGRPLVEQLGKELFEKSLPNMQKALAGEVVEFTRQTNSPLASYPQHVAVTYIPDRAADGTVLGFNILAFDATQQQQHERELLQLANQDSLTGLPNRRLFHDRLAHALAQGRRHRRITALIYLDIDHFKRINDTLGHEQGDHLLVAVAQRLRGAVRVSDTVARLGGDEFVVLMEDLRTTEDAQVVAHKILAALRAPVELAGETRAVTASLGLAFAAAQDDAPEQLIRRSDAALYEAKAGGRNRYAVCREAAASASAVAAD